MAERERELHRSRERTLAGDPRTAGARREIAASWRRVEACGLAPGSEPSVAPLGTAELERRREDSGLAARVPRLTQALSSVIEAGQMVVVAGTDGRVLWRAGSSGVRRLADGLGFVGGSAWTEGNVGTNAIGTCLVLGEGVHIQGPEHFVESHTRWGCAAAPLTDPWSGATLGVVDVSGPSRGMHPAELALVEMAARMTALEIVAEHRARLDRLRAVAAPLLARVGGEALAVDTSGHLAAAVGLAAPDRVVLPDDLSGGSIWLPTLGAASAEPLPGGWLLRLGERSAAPSTSLVLDLSSAPTVAVSGPSGSWVHALSPRHAEILVALVRAGSEGRTAAGLADDLFGDSTRLVTVRAEVSRLRRALGGVLVTQPYRIAPSVRAALVLPDDPAATLPCSSAPVVTALRG
ncbi:GAF domain-containing protein [Nocardioides sp.]|uniref:GAF domain-containing protein n=1 Tax=Nocardioides sp. TaxID=35761 RepID=UPI003D09718B